ncbi:STAS domain-containing protein [Mycobacterium sp. ML4]
MATPLTVNTGRGADGTPRLTASGEIDLSNIEVFKRALSDTNTGTREPIIIDLSAVKYVDSAGINALFDQADAVDQLRVIVHPLLVRVLTVSGFSKVATVESASTDGGGD